MYAADNSADGVLVAVAREFSPRIAVPPVATPRDDGREVLLDLSGLTRLFGEAQAIAAELRRTAADRGLRVRVALAGSRTAARLLVHHRPGVTVIAPGGEAEAVGPLPLEALRVLCTGEGPASDPESLIAAVRRWGVRTLAAFAALPGDEVVARLGQPASRWQRAALGVDLDPLVPAVPEERFEQALDLEWPIEGLEPLSFVLGRLLEPLSAQLERRDRGAAVLHVRLHLVTRDVHERSLQLPVPMREPRTLRTLLLLDLESHPPAAAIDRVVVAVDPTPGRIVQFSLLTRPLPTPERVSTLMARLQALMGESRCGSPAVVDSWEPGAFAMKPFAPTEGTGQSALRVSVPPRPVEQSLRIPNPESRLPAEARSAKGGGPNVALRRFRMPVVARVQVHGGQPVRVQVDRRGVASGPVLTCAGPWRTSGGWWIDRAAAPSTGAPSCWDRDEWDVALAGGVTYRMFRERDSETWFIEGIVD
jgi:protein ImuB